MDECRYYDTRNKGVLNGTGPLDDDILCSTTPLFVFFFFLFFYKIVKKTEFFCPFLVNFSIF